LRYLDGCLHESRFLYLTTFSNVYKEKYLIAASPNGVHDGMCIAKTIHGLLRYREGLAVNDDDGGINDDQLKQIARFDGQLVNNRPAFLAFLDQLIAWLRASSMVQEASRAHNHKSVVLAAQPHENVRVEFNQWLNLGVFGCVPHEVGRFAVFGTGNNDPWSASAAAIYPTNNASVFWGLQIRHNFLNGNVYHDHTSLPYHYLTRVCGAANVARVGYLNQSVFPIARRHEHEENMCIRECIEDLNARIYANRERIAQLFALLDALPLVRGNGVPVGVAAPQVVRLLDDGDDIEDIAN